MFLTKNMLMNYCSRATLVIMLWTFGYIGLAHSEPVFDVTSIHIDVAMEVATEQVANPQSPAYYRQQGGGVLWLPDMGVKGHFILFNQRKEDYIFLPEGKGLSDRVTVAGAYVDGKHVSEENLPPVKVTLAKTPRGENGDVAIYPMRKGGVGLAIYFEFLSPPTYKWKEGAYSLTFKIDLDPGVSEPRLVNTMFRIKYIEKEEDRLNVLWHRYLQIKSPALRWLPGMRKLWMTEGLELINALLEKFPNKVNFVDERATIYELCDRNEEAIQEITRIIELVQGGQPAPSKQILGSHEPDTPNETVAMYQKRISSLRKKIETENFLNSLTETLTDTDKKRVINYLRWGDMHISPLALEVIAKLKIQKAVIPLVAEMSEPEYVADDADLIQRKRAWEVLLLLRPEVEKFKYDPTASEADRLIMYKELKAFLTKVE